MGSIYLPGGVCESHGGRSGGGIYLRLAAHGALREDRRIISTFLSLSSLIFYEGDKMISLAVGEKVIGDGRRPCLWRFAVREKVGATCLVPLEFRSTNLCRRHEQSCQRHLTIVTKHALHRDDTEAYHLGMDRYQSENEHCALHNRVSHTPKIHDITQN